MKYLINRIQLALLFNVILIYAAIGRTNDSTIHYTDICIYGATSAGVIAAYTSAKCGNSVVLIEPGKRIGGLTTGGLGQTDAGIKESVTGISRQFYQRIAKEYRHPTGEEWKFEPRVALQVMQDFIREGGIKLLMGTQLSSVEKEKTVIHSIKLHNTHNGQPVTIHAKQFLDCTYEGDLMAMSGVSYVIGREDNCHYDETLNGFQIAENHQFPDGISAFKIPGDTSSGLVWGVSKDSLRPCGSDDKKVQAYNFRICLTDSIENRIPITRPLNYDSSKYELLVRLFKARPKRKSIHYYFMWHSMPNRKTDINNRGGFSTDLIGMNHAWPEANYEQREKMLQEAISYTKGLLYFMTTDKRVPRKLQAFIKNWGYPKDEYEQFGNFTPQLYVREARRMIGSYIMTEHNCTGNVKIEDGIGFASYTMDSHSCDRIVVDGMVKNEGNIEVRVEQPYAISYFSLTPKQKGCTNLLVPVCLSSSHVAYGSIRMEPVFMVLGQSAAMAASLAIAKNVPVQKINVFRLQQWLEEDPYLQTPIKKESKYIAKP